MAEPDARYATLLDALAADGGLIVAFSGGVDSTLLLTAARDAQERTAQSGPLLAVNIVSAFQQEREADAAGELAATLGVEHRRLTVDLLADASIRANPAERCYLCKRRIFEALGALAAAEGIATIVEGSNVDDATDYRPGERAIAELGIRSPLRDAGLTKHDIRQLARARGLGNWDKPAQACLASRVPYGEPLTAAKLRRIDRAEQVLREAGFAQVRVRDHGTLARIEVPQPMIAALQELANTQPEVVAQLEAAGYSYVTVDIKGYRRGAMNEVLPEAGGSTDGGEA